jgi:hypothetical protein
MAEYTKISLWWQLLNLVMHQTPVDDLSRSKACTPGHRGHRELLKISLLFSVISVLSSERSERVVKSILGFSTCCTFQLAASA